MARQPWGGRPGQRPGRALRWTVRPVAPVPDGLRPFLRTQHGLRRRIRGRRPPRGEVVVNIGWLTLTLLLPFVGACATMAVPKSKALLAKQVALGFSLATLVL